VEVSAETAARSTLGQILVGTRVNLELPLRVGDRLDGHLVQGHTDGVGKIARVDEEHGGCRRVWIRPPRRFLDEIVAKGFVAVEGVSVTVAERLADRFSVALIPTTLRETTLAGLRPEDRVNLESDLFVKSARDLWQSARVIATRTLSALPWAGELTGPAGVDNCAAQLAAGGGVVIYPGTGVSAHDRAATIRRLAHPDATPADFLRPGHVFPLAGRPDGLAVRRGHTEASLALCAAGGLPTVAVICEVMGPDGHMLTGPAVERFALAWSLPLISVDELALHL
jgi:riboflavin synthase alpha subunit